MFLAPEASTEKRGIFARRESSIRYTCPTRRNRAFNIRHVSSVKQFLVGDFVAPSNAYHFEQATEMKLIQGSQLLPVQRPSFTVELGNDGSCSLDCCILLTLDSKACQKKHLLLQFWSRLL